MVHQFDPHRRPDSGFEPGQPEHLVVGNTGRLMDPRRTPISITGIDLDSGHVLIRIEGFEDRGAIWEVPFERISSYQFERGGPRAGVESVKEYQAVVRRFNVPLVIRRSEEHRARTDIRLSFETERAASWVKANSTIFGSRRIFRPDLKRGDPELWHDFQAYMHSVGMDDMEAVFALQFVSNPHSGELVKGHRIVMAELGLAGFEDTMIRSPGLFSGIWSKEHRANHICARLGFVRAMFAQSGHDSLCLYRGVHHSSWPVTQELRTFVSASCDKGVAESCSGEREGKGFGQLLRATVPVGRVFMSYFETEAMNRQFEEAEVVLLHDSEAMF